MQLRDRLAPIMLSEDEAMRFLAARRGDVTKAAKLFTAFVEWRKAEEIAGILDEPPLQPPEREAALERCFNPIVLQGNDFKGRCACARLSQHSARACPPTPAPLPLPAHGHLALRSRRVQTGDVLAHR